MQYGEGRGVMEHDLREHFAQICADNILKRLHKQRKLSGKGRKKYTEACGIPIRGTLLTSYQIPVIVYEASNGDRLFTVDGHIIKVVHEEVEEVGLW
jgi:hypothetical protein